MIDKNTRDQALKNAKNLISYQQKGVYINRDRTQNEMLLDNELLKQRNELNAMLPEIDSSGKLRFGTEDGKKWYWGIRLAELRKIDKVTGRILIRPQQQLNTSPFKQNNGLVHDRILIHPQQQPRTIPVKTSNDMAARPVTTETRSRSPLKFINFDSPVRCGLTFDGGLEFLPTGQLEETYTK